MTPSTALLTPLPPYRLSPSRSSTASKAPVDAPEGTAARPSEPSSRMTSTSTVGLPRESRISRAPMNSMLATSAAFPMLPPEWPTDVRAEETDGGLSLSAGQDCADFDRLSPRSWALLLLAEAACVNPVHPDNASPGDGNSDDAWINLAGGDCCDWDTHHHGDDCQRELSSSAALLRRLGPTGLQSLLSKLRSTRLRNLFDPLGQARGNVLVVFRTQLHPGCERSLGITLQLLARLTWGMPILRLYRIGHSRIQRVWLSWRILCRIVPGRVVLRRVVLRRIVLGRVILRRVVLGRMRRRGRPLLRRLGHVHRIGDGC